jgi:hypothetical protein
VGVGVGRRRWDGGCGEGMLSASGRAWVKFRRGLETREGVKRGMGRLSDE